MYIYAYVTPVKNNYICHGESCHPLENMLREKSGFFYRKKVVFETLTEVT
jgi:hypothetical protein